MHDTVSNHVNWLFQDYEVPGKALALKEIYASSPNPHSVNICGTPVGARLWGHTVGNQPMLA